MFNGGFWVSGDCCSCWYFSAWQGLCYKEREGRRVVALPPSSFSLEDISAPALLQWRQRQVPYDLELMVTGPVHRKPGVCSMVVITSHLCTLHERSAGKQPHTHYGCTSHSLQASKASATFLHPEELVFALFSRLPGRHRSHVQMCGLFRAPGVWIFTVCRITMLTFANKM